MTDREILRGPNGELLPGTASLNEVRTVNRDRAIAHGVEAIGGIAAIPWPLKRVVYQVWQEEGQGQSFAVIAQLVNDQLGQIWMRDARMTETFLSSDPLSFHYLEHAFAAAHLLPILENPEAVHLEPIIPGIPSLFYRLLQREMHSPPKNENFSIHKNALKLLAIYLMYDVEMRTILRREFGTYIDEYEEKTEQDYRHRPEEYGHRLQRIVTWRMAQNNDMFPYSRIPRPIMGIIIRRASIQIMEQHGLEETPKFICPEIDRLILQCYLTCNGIAFPNVRLITATLNAHMIKHLASQGYQVGERRQNIALFQPPTPGVALHLLTGVPMKLHNTS